ncbi:MAG: hypothetical protein EA398_16710 [Deltaproteobacteria bacterium]|nr:MAG: hypothetical protein EA398_16710 [Deltaproteobacteria bacterium]
MQYDLFEGIMAGLREEMRTVRSGEALESLALHAGRLEGRLGHHYLYSFRRAEGPVRHPVGGRLRVYAGTGDWEEHPAITHCSKTRSIELLLEKEIGSHVPEADLRWQDDTILRALRDRLLDQRQQVEDRARALFGGGTVTPPGVGGGTRVPAIAGLNPVQAQAVQLARTTPRCVIWGPPGTGKTVTAAALVRELVSDGRCVLMTAPTNRAVDVLLMRSVEELGWSREALETSVFRIGDADPGIVPAPLRDVLVLHRLLDVRRAELDLEIAQVGAEIHELRSARRVSPGRSDLDRIEEAIREAERWAATLEHRRHNLDAHVLADARIFATTAHRAAMGQVPKPIDHLVLDEASMAPLPVALLAAVGIPRVTLIGDRRQLAPVVRSSAPAARRFWGSSPLDPEKALPAAGTLPTVMLNVQYRMRMGDLVSRLSYDGRLVTSPEIAAASAPEWTTSLLRSPLQYLHFREGDPKGPTPAGRPRENLALATAVAGLVRRILAQADETRPEIMVLSPYRSHVRAIQKALGREGLGGSAAVSTVHRAQGREADLVILSLPERHGEALGPFLRAHNLEDDGGRLLTVALSRARHNLIVAGDLTWIRQMTPRAGVVRRFLELLAELGSRLEQVTPAGEPRPGTSGPPRSGTSDRAHLAQSPEEVPGDSLTPNREST